MATKKRVIKNAGGRGPKAEKAAAPQAPGTKRGGKWPVILGLLVAAGLLVQGAFVYLGSKKKEIVLRFEGAVAPRGEGRQEVVGARHLAVGPSGEVAYLYGVGETSTLKLFGADGKLQGVYEPKKPLDKLVNGWAVAIGPDGVLWVAERGSGRVLRISPKMELLSAAKAPSPDLTGIAVAPDGRAWVAPFGPKVYVFDAKGALEKEFRGAAKGPLAAAYRLAVDKDGTLAVLDAARGQGKDPDVKLYAKDGSLAANFMAKGVPFNEFSCVAFDPQGYIVLNNNGMDSSNSLGVELFDRKGKLKAVAGSASNQANLRMVPGLAVGPTGKWALDTTPQGRGCDAFTLPEMAAE